MQIYSKSGMPLGKKEKSHSAEFSVNPDERLKREISYLEHTQRVKSDLNRQDSLRIQVNKLRHEKGLKLFSDREEFEDLVDECGYEDSKLFHYLVVYDSDETFDYEDLAEESIFIYDTVPAVSSNYLAEYLEVEHSEIINLSYLVSNQLINMDYMKSISLKNGQGLIITYYRLMFFILLVENSSLNKKMYSLLQDMKIFNKGSSIGIFTFLDKRFQYLEKEVEEKINSYDTVSREI